MYRRGVATGHWWRWCEGGGWLSGAVDSAGHHTGDNIAFIYPDLTTALLGEYDQGEAVSVSPASLVSVNTPEQGIAVPVFQARPRIV